VQKVVRSALVIVICLLAAGCASGPAPRPLALCEDPSVNEMAFYVMTHCPGVVPAEGLPAGFAATPVRPQGAFFHEQLGEFILPYRSVRTAPDPDAVVLSFLQATYEAAADLAHWDRPALERPGSSTPPGGHE